MKSALFLLLPLFLASIAVAAEPQKEKGDAAPDGDATPAHLFILSGQSNMVRLDPKTSFTPAVTEAFGVDSVIVVKDAANGQSIQRWYKDWQSAEGKPSKFKGDLYDRLMKKVKAAIEGRELTTITFVWMQGENDASKNQTAVYKKSFTGLMDQLRTDLGRNGIYFVIGRLSDYSLDSGKHPQWQAMRDLQVAIADASPLGAWVNTDDVNNKTNPKTDEEYNDVHYTNEGYKVFGKRLADSAIKLIAENQSKTKAAEPN